MSSGVTLNAATRQNLLSLQGTAELVATTQNRLATGKKVNTALDNPTSFFTASALTSRSSNLSSLLDGIGNGIQTIQAANTGLSKLQSLTSQLKSTAQQALASTNAFTAKATATSTALSGATAANLLSTGATVATGTAALGTLTGTTPPTAPVPAALTGSVDYKPTASATKMSGAVYTPTVSTVASATGGLFTQPANAVAGTAVGGTYTAPATGSTLSITSGSGAAISVTFTDGSNGTIDNSSTIAKAVAAIQSALNNAGSTITVAAGSNSNNGKIVFTGATNGDALTLQSSASGIGFGSGTGNAATGAVSATGNFAAAQQTLTINNTAITIKGGNAGDTAATVLANAAAAINAANTGANATGVSAAVGLGNDAGKLVLTGKADGTNFTAQGAANNTLGFAANAAPTANGSPAASQTLTINGTQISIAGGATQAQALAAINAQTGVTGVTASQDPSNPSKIALTGKSDGSSFTVSASNAASSGFAAATTTSSIAATVVGGAYSAGGIRAAVTGTPFTLPANAIAATATGTATFAAPANAQAATVVASASFALPANAVAGTALGTANYSSPANGATLVIKSAGTTVLTYTFGASEDLDTAIGNINTQLGASTIRASRGSGGDSSKLLITGNTNGEVLNVQGSDSNIGFGTNAGTSITSSNNAAAKSQIYDFGGGHSVTVSGGNAGSAAKTLQNVVDAINGASGAMTALTGVTASIDGTTNRLALTGKSDGTSFAVTTSGTAATGITSGTFNSTPAARQTLTITNSNNVATTINIDGGAIGAATADVNAAALTAINGQTATTGVSASFNQAGRLVLSSNSGASFTAVGSAGNTLGIATGAGVTANNGTAAASQTLQINGTTVTIKGGNAGDTAATVTAAAVASINGVNGATTTITGVSAQAVGGSFVLTGDTTGANFTVTGAAGNTLGFAPGTTTTTNGTPPSAQTLTINGTAITLAAGTSLANAVTAINAQTTTTGVTASVDPTTGHLALTGKTDGTSFTVASSNPAANGFGALPTTINGTAGASQTLTINNTAITIPASASLDDAIKAINLQSTTTGVTASKDTSNGGNKLVLSGPSDGSSFSLQGSAGNTLGVATTASKVAGTLDPSPTSLATVLGFTAGDNFSVNGQLVTISATDTISSLAQKVGAATNGAVTASYDTVSNKFSFTAADSGTAVTLGDGSTATSKVSNLGFTTTAFAAGLGGANVNSALQGKSITVQVGSGANISTTSLTFGSAPGQVSTLAQLNAMLAASNAQATIDSATGKLSISTTNDMGAENLSIIASGTGNPFTTGTSSAQIGGDGATTRTNLVTTYNNLLTQIDQLAADSGYNGINLLTGDNMKIDFNEKGTSSLSIQGNSITAANLGLSAIGQSTFLESSSINKLIETINTSSNTLKSQASALGSNLSVVQNRQDFSKQLINILDTGAANLTNADLNEEAANSQALSTRQSLGISALSLANQAQQGILQLLR